ncbi:putative aminophospholipid-translocase, partial [Kappamyces sp. JEL0680]
MESLSHGAGAHDDDDSDLDQDGKSFSLGSLPSGQPLNVVRNQKYSLFTFVPLILWNEFKFFFNLYFLLVALSQLVKPLQVGYPSSYFGPLAFVLLVTMSKEAHDDYIREANSQVYELITEDGPKTVTSSYLQVGHLVVIPKNGKVPADCILMRTVDSSGTCFIRTDQLDGETDWKLRIAVPSSQILPTHQSLLDESAHIYVEDPHKDIHSFVGTIKWKFGDNVKMDSLGVENVLWMNTINASDPVLGLIVYTGSDTRAVMNTSFASTKVGLVDLEINLLAKILAFVTLVLSIAMVALDGFKGLWGIYALRFLILFSSIIPISLRVNLDMGKTMYSYLMQRDDQIPDTIVRTSSIPEELGRIDYLLTDKTGTLTRNEMDLKKLHMGTMQFDTESMEELKSQLKQAFSTSKQQDLFAFKRHQGISGRIKDVVCALALCHNVTPSVNDDGEISLQAASPDEVAIVSWTASLGLRLVHRDLHALVLDFEGHRLEYIILETFPFTSESKRMGIILQEKNSGEIVFLQKGADVIMTKIVMASDWLEEECANMAREGLRTLVIGRKILALEHYHEFKHQLDAARLSTMGRNEAIARVLKTYLERDLELLGLTGVEDQLQKDVKLTLELLRNAGLKVWMLTGDKIETATNIALSSKLFARNQAICQIEKIRDLDVALSTLDSIRQKRDCCIVVDGESLQFYLDHAPKELIDVALHAPAVVCSRCTPTQKADIVNLINVSTKKRTCAIGDGGNDVSMIQAAHVGIGLVGKEGKQASLAADFSLTQFSHLSRLLLWHGRNSYKRSSKLAHFVIHRGLIISIMQAVFSALFYF